MGDTEQIDHPYLDEYNNGLTYVVESFKDQHIAGHIKLIKGERSALAQLAQKAVRANENKTPAQVKQKIQDVLLRKGYSYTVVTEILEQIKLERREDEWSTLIETQGEKVWRKYASKFEGFELNQKVKQSLYQKGFPIDIITEFIEQKEQQQNE